MWASVDLCLVPLGVGTSLSPYLALCQEVIEKSGLDYELGPNGTAIEGEWDGANASGFLPAGGTVVLDAASSDVNLELHASAYFHHLT